MKDKKILVYGDGYYRQMGNKGMDKLPPSEMVKAIHLPDVYEFMSMVEDAMYPTKVENVNWWHHEIVDNHRLRILDRRAMRNIGTDRIESGYCWAPVFVGDAGSMGWDYSDFLDKDERVFRFLPEKNKKYREASLWNRRRVQMLIAGNCTGLPDIMTRPISEDEYWCLLGELVILSISMHIPQMRVLFEDAAAVPEYIEKKQQATAGPFIYLDGNMLCPGDVLKYLTYEDLLKPVYIKFDLEQTAQMKEYDLMFRSLTNWKANVESYGLNLYWRN